ncbi:MAG: GNAT family N-acetyltransferase [Chitinophagaceae bacterium]|nr:GNAT family N-acetyltransferase [Chitinophagaceae bacterium]
MTPSMTIDDIIIRTELQAGDIGYITHLHGILYKKEYDYGIAFEAYVANGLIEFYAMYNPEKDRVWICEHATRIIGFLLLMDRGNDTAQLRYFIIEPAYRGIGLGRKLMRLYMAHLKSRGYTHSYLWTTHEQQAAAYLYLKEGFVLTEEKNSSAFGKPLTEQRYDLNS